MDATLSTEQFKEIKRAVWLARQDFDFALQPVVTELEKANVGKDVMLDTIRSAGQRCLWLTASDTAALAGVELPEYANATGRVRTLVDLEAATFAELLCKAA